MNCTIGFGASHNDEFFVESGIGAMADRQQGYRKKLLSSS